jgi:hypothetical protein
MSRLIIKNATFDDGGVYKCAAKSSHVPEVSDTEGIQVQEGPGSNCIDRPSYTHCDKVRESTDQGGGRGITWGSTVQIKKKTRTSQ